MANTTELSQPLPEVSGIAGELSGSIKATSVRAASNMDVLQNILPA
jgi:hypothetical protein